ncbi:hypothetical protein ACOJUR_12020 [Alicyclobacillus tolerans]|uniref:hypothetical protein n=1 Tax=Alicyclobacillus tolerans TaxID=90970 RepID=UPI003B7D4BE5
MSELQKIIYTNEKSNQYMRLYANTTNISVNPENVIILDFFEEYVPPNFIVTQNIHNGEFHPEYQHDREKILDVTREHKATILLTFNAAKNLVETLSKFLDGETK